MLSRYGSEHYYDKDLEIFSSPYLVLFETDFLSGKEENVVSN